jgi:serine/threonine protein kinase
MHVDEVFDCSSIKNFAGSIVEELNYRGISMSRFYLCRIDDSKFLTKLSFYKKSPPELYKRTNRMNHIDTEIAILSLLREKVIDAGVAPGVVEILYERRCTGVVKYSSDHSVSNPITHNLYDTFKNYTHMIERGIAEDKWAFIVLEQCDITLEEYLRHRIGTPVAVEIFKTLMFQIIYTVHAINQVLPSFKHNDLHTENIMLKIDHGYRWSKRAFLKYTVAGTDFYMPYFGIIVKIIDFGFSSVSDLGIVSSVVDDMTIMYYRHDSDLLTLFHWINRTVLKFPTYDNDVDKLLRRLDPEQSYLDRTSDVPAPTPLSMIENSVFTYYTQVPPGDINILHHYSI